MNTPALFTVLSCLLVAAYSIPVSPPFIPSPDVKKCSEENHIDALRGSQLSRHVIAAQTNDDKCYLSCYLKAKEYFVNGKIDFAKLYESHAKYVQDKNQLDKLKETFDQCEKNMVYEGKNDCEIAYSAYQCAPTS
ncbi:hypothetical protein O3M35_000862 [Rhynocoris fuscipes]|uniref:Uncharacterized protein n=1 Tax=Rhynocoris fuscipes TaxID=488301 RepID=A0AAW1DRI1_9HEMI